MAVEKLSKAKGFLSKVVCGKRVKCLENGSV